ncbi:MAG: thiamine phosphate synthase [Bryobacteraceae bacterium]
MTIALPRFYPILDIGLLTARRAQPLEAARAMLHGGAEILQWRCKLPVTRRRFEEAEQVAALCARFHVPFVVNDRADVALQLEAWLHLGQDDLAPRSARGLLPHAAIGYSTHNAEQLAEGAGEPVDYLAIGPMFATRSKENADPVVGIERLWQWRGLAGGRPLVAIGGITRSNAIRVVEAGASSLAVIGDLYPQGSAPAAIEERTREWIDLLR